MMGYRYEILNFLADYREYNFTTFQVVLFKDSQKDSILNVINNNDCFYLFSLKQSQIYNKVVEMSDVSSNSVFNLLFNSYDATIYPIDDDNNQMIDLFNNKTLLENNYKYLIIHPIYDKENLKGALFIYSNYQLLWQLSDSVTLKFINNLEKGLEDETFLNIEKNLFSSDEKKYYVVTSDNKYLLSPDLAKEEGFKVKDNTLFDGFYLKEEIKYENYSVILLNKYPDLKLLSYLEMIDKDVETIIYIRCMDDLSKDYSKIKKVFLDNIQDLENVLIYQLDSSLIITLNNTLSKNQIEKMLDGFDYTFIRWKKEITKSFSMNYLIKYLSISHDAQFDEKKYQLFVDKEIIKEKNKILKKYNQESIQSINFFKSDDMINNGVFIYSINRNEYEDKNFKLKRINDLIDYQNKMDNNINILVEINYTDLFYKGKIYHAAINSLIKYLNRGKYIVLSCDGTIVEEICKYIPNLKDYLFIADDDLSHYKLYDFEDILGIVLNSKDFENLQNIKAKSSLVKDLSNKFNNLIVSCKQNEIIYYHKNNVSLMVLDAKE